MWIHVHVCRIFMGAITFYFRLEKLEYKEIMTPRWRELKTTRTDTTSGSAPILSDLEVSIFM